MAVLSADLQQYVWSRTLWFRQEAEQFAAQIYQRNDYPRSVWSKHLTFEHYPPIPDYSKKLRDTASGIRASTFMTREYAIWSRIDITKFSPCRDTDI